MTLCHPSVQDGDGRLVDRRRRGRLVRARRQPAPLRRGRRTSSARCIHPDQPLVFFNIHGVARRDRAAVGAHARLERQAVPEPARRDRPLEIRGVISEPEPVDVRTFGVRMPACTRDNPTYGIMGVMHLVPPSLAWVWRLIAPRGDKNPSIGESTSEAGRLEHGGLVAEGVGSYWPFSTGTKVAAANLLLRQILAHPRTRYVLTPNQHIGAYQRGLRRRVADPRVPRPSRRRPHARASS